MPAAPKLATLFADQLYHTVLPTDFLKDPKLISLLSLGDTDIAGGNSASAAYQTVHFHNCRTVAVVFRHPNRLCVIPAK